MKPPFRIWRIWHQVKLARRKGDTAKLRNLYRQYLKVAPVGEQK